MTIKQIVDVLSTAIKLKGDLPAYFDFCMTIPDHVSSWRGDYSLPAIGWKYDPGAICTAKDLLAWLNYAISGAEFTGWKGGQYRYNDDQELMVDNYGEATFTRVRNITFDNLQITLHTEKR